MTLPVRLVAALCSACYAALIALVLVTLLVIVVGPLVPQRFIGAVLGVWFVAGTLALRSSSSVTEWARGSGVVTSAIAVAAPAVPTLPATTPVGDRPDIRERFSVITEHLIGHHSEPASVSV